MTYDFIYKNWNERDKFFIILERPDSSRSDVYNAIIDEYFIVNSNVIDSKHTIAGASRDYFNPKLKKVDEKFKDVFTNWYKNHYNFENNIMQDEKAFVGLYSFCKLNQIKIILMNKNQLIFDDVFDSNDIIKFSNDNQSDDIYNWCLRNKLTIRDEVSDEMIDYIDTHPGYFGHIEYAKNLAKFLGWDSEYTKIKNKLI
jgi:hypothetical protein